MKAKPQRRRFNPADRSIYVIRASTGEIIGNVFYTCEREAREDASIVQRKYKSAALQRVRHVNFFKNRRADIRKGLA